ncbi:hypothetical protein F5Y10DRAFT_270835 [Nemania abortiva]|nr:hypothetical protein F5Y10DRAFT_270835 [Nemania abortiva]
MVGETGGTAVCDSPQQQRGVLPSLSPVYAVDVGADGVDWMDPKYIRNMPIKPHDQMSNQRWLTLAGIGRDRYRIKIPATGPALNAAKILPQEGIPTVGTAVFGLPQAIACSQAGCLYISPYYNENRAHDDLTLWPDVEDPAKEHPNSPCMAQIIEIDVQTTLYRDRQRAAAAKLLCSFLGAKEAIAAGEMGCHSATVSHTVLDQLAKLRYNASEQPGEGETKPEQSLQNPLANGRTPGRPIEYRPSGGYVGWQASAEFQQAIENDPVAANRLADALQLFLGGGEKGETSSRKKCERRGNGSILGGGTQAT